MPRPSLVGIVGSREWIDLDRVREYTAGLIVRNRARGREVKIVSGGARGVDRVAIETAKKLRASYEDIDAEWDRLGRGHAGFQRNEELVQYVTHVVVFWNGWSKGTRDTIERAQRSSKLRWLECEIDCHSEDASGRCLGPPCPDCFENTCLNAWAQSHLGPRFHMNCGR